MIFGHQIKLVTTSCCINLKTFAIWLVQDGSIDLVSILTSDLSKLMENSTPVHHATRK